MTFKPAQLASESALVIVATVIGSIGAPLLAAFVSALLAMGK